MRSVFLVTLVLIGLPVVYCGVGFLVFANEENVELRSTVTGANVTRKETLRYGVKRYKLSYSQKGITYTNAIRTDAHDFSVGDSVLVRIDSQNPETHCELLD